MTNALMDNLPKMHMISQQRPLQQHEHINLLKMFYLASKFDVDWNLQKFALEMLNSNKPDVLKNSAEFFQLNNQFL